MAFLTPNPIPTASSSRNPAVSTRPVISASVANSTQAPPRPSRVVLSPLPTVFVYDHCPFCVRVRHLLGLKNIKYDLVWLANDDAETPTNLVGRKVVPIFQPNGRAGDAMAESLDICELIDKDPRYGPTGFFKSQTSREDIAKWMDDLAMPMRRLTRTRFVSAPLPEFVFEEARKAYIKNHPLKDPDSYEENMKRSSEYLQQVQEKLDELAEMIESPYYCSPEGLSIDDIILFPRLRALTIMKGLILPKKIRDYVEYHSEAAEIPLYDYCAM